MSEMTNQEATEDSIEEMLARWDSATSISVSIIGLLPEQYDTVDAEEYTPSEGMRHTFKMKMIDRAWVHYHKRAE